MAMQVKHMLTVGLGLGVATALGYQFLSNPNYEAVTENASSMAPLSRFEIDATPPSMSASPMKPASPIMSASPTASESLAPFESTAVPAQPPVDNQFRSEATPLRSATSDQAVTVQPSSSYKDLVAAAQTAVQSAVPTAAEPVGFQQLSVESDESDDGFSLDLSEPETSKAPEFVFDDQEQSMQQPAVQAPSTQELDLTFPETGFESIEVIAAQNQDESLAVVADFNPAQNGSAEKNQNTKKNSWKANPFINDSAQAEGAATSFESDATSFEGAATSFDDDALPQASSVLSLNDPDHDALVAAGESFQTMSATAIPNSIQPQSQMTNGQMATQAVQFAPGGQMPLNAADALKAVHHIEYGKTLSRRGAAQTARQEFLAAMQLIATANDKVSGTSQHTKALRSAMLAIKEAGDFSVANSEQQIQMNVASVAESHRSNVLSPTQAANLSPTQAMNRYFAKAQEQLDFAGGRNVVSAEVFYCMGKLHTVLSQNQKVLGPYDTAKSVVYHQVALLSDNQHYRSSNELGVLLARSGRLEQAKLLFERSLMSQPTVRTWQNLAEAHRRLGESDFANRAHSEVQMLATSQPSPAHSTIQWKPIDQFNADAPVEYNQRVAELPSPPAASAAEVPAEKSKPSKSIAERIKGIF